MTGGSVFFFQVRVMRKLNIYGLLKSLVAATMAVGLTACSQEKFHVVGTIGEAKDSILYFEHVSLDGPVVVDSVKLPKSGEFSFSDERPEAPEFYRLRIAGQVINIAVDSTETVTVKASWPTMPTAYEVSGSDNCERIRQLSLMQIDLTERAIAVDRDENLNAAQVQDSILRMMESYKKDVCDRYIFKDPKASSSYFALFQTLGNLLIFNPQSNQQDIKVFAAVATSWDTFYPGSLRGQNLHNIALEGMKNRNIVKARQLQSIDATKVVSSGIIEISLPDIKGGERKLSSLKGQVVLLDFHVYGMNESPARILMLRELYNKYHPKGLEIYQVGLDSNEHYWKQQTAQLPWVCVYDEDGATSTTLANYNVTTVPEFFLIDRGNNLVSRSSQITDLEKEIEMLLNQGGAS